MCPSDSQQNNLIEDFQVSFKFAVHANGHEYHLVSNIFINYFYSIVFFVIAKFIKESFQKLQSFVLQIYILCTVSQHVQKLILTM